MGLFASIFGGVGKNALLKAETRGRTEDQDSVIRYFNSEGGCFGGFYGFKDKDFDNMLSGYVKDLNVMQMALKKLCIDESQVQESSPVFLDGYYFDSFRTLGDALLTGRADVSKIMGSEGDAIGTYVKVGKDDLYRFSKYRLSCLLFSADQLYYYSYRFDMTNLNTREETAEFFYKDIDSVQVITKVSDMKVPAKGCLGIFKAPKYETYSYPELIITVPGASFSCSMRTENESSLHGLKNLIRDKKKQLG